MNRTKCIRVLVMVLAAAMSVAHAEWPKEYRDVVTGNCVIRFSGNTEIPMKYKRIVEDACKCATEGYQENISIERMREFSAMTPEDAEAAPENDVMRKVLDECGTKHNIDELDNMPVAAEVREMTFFMCGFEGAKEFAWARDSIDGWEGIYKACACAINFAARKPTPSAKEMADAGDACEAKFLPKK